MPVDAFVFLQKEREDGNQIVFKLCVGEVCFD
jgi:hypothetical protein